MNGVNTHWGNTSSGHSACDIGDDFDGDAAGGIDGDTDGGFVSDRGGRRHALVETGITGVGGDACSISAAHRTRRKKQQTQFRTQGVKVCEPGLRRSAGCLVWV